MAAALESEHWAALSLPELGILIASGRDCTKFLQAQLTNDIESLSDGHAIMAAWCDPKGRTLALFTVCRLGEDIALVAPKAVIDQHLARLRMFVLRAKVTLTPADDRLVCGVFGDDGAALLGEHITPVPGPGEAVHGPDVSVLGLLGGRRWLVLCQTDKSPEWMALLSNDSEELHNAWRLSGVEAGAPDVVGTTSGEFIPQMLNLELLDGVSFSKGCYPGQEIVARTQYLGRIKRRMLRLRSEATPQVLPDAGAEVRDSNGRKVGLVTSVAREASAHVTALAVLRIDDVGKAPLTVDGQSYAPVPLPYPLEAEKSTD